LANISLPAELSLMDLWISSVEKRNWKRFCRISKTPGRHHQQTFKASEKIEAVRQFSKPGQVQMEAVDVTRILQKQREPVRPSPTQNQHARTYGVSSAMSPVRGDAKQLEIVFVNLIKNATEAMAQHSSAGLSRELWIKDTKTATGWWLPSRTRVRASNAPISGTSLKRIYDQGRGRDRHGPVPLASSH